MGNADTDARYWAFISYSHKDAAFGRRLHRLLESYVMPRRLVGRATALGLVPRKLAPIFRDREELPAAHDLTGEVRNALKASRSLIVVCSPAAAASRWVAKEIEVFHELHPDRPVLAALRTGNPQDGFPATLRIGGPEGSAIEPLAADFRRERDGEHLGLLKLVSGMLGLGLDELVQRDAHRRTQRVTAVTAGALAAMLAMGVLTLFAFDARIEAERQRYQAEGMVEFMLTDLREKLKGVGRLDIMTAVNERALHYYAGQDLDELSPDSLGRRARILHAIGEDDEARGNHDAALEKFQEARRTTAELLAQAPDDPERIFNQAQSDYWIGYADFQHERYADAKTAFLAYKDHAERLAAIAPRNSRYRQELSYADSNLCATALEKPVDAATAVRYCTDALEQMQRAVRGREKTDKAINLLIERHAWLADAYLARGEAEQAREQRRIEAGMLDGLIAEDPQNQDLKGTWVALHIAVAEIEHELGRSAAGIEELRRALPVAEAMEKLDPSNVDWRDQREFIAAEIGRWQAQQQQEKGK